MGLSSSVNVNVEPLPISLVTHIFPPCSSTNFLAKVTQSGPLDLVCIVGAYLAEFLEYLGLVLRGDADAGVTDRDLHCVVGLPGANSDPSSLWRELHRIGSIQS